MNCNPMENIPEYFSGRSVFITGATGFMGKVLIEKLLRSCPDVRNIYILVRNKKNKKTEERVKEITDSKLFDRLKFEQPHALEKLKPIFGDILEIGLGISDEDKQILIEHVSIVYNSAASVRFHGALKHAILANTRSTREIVRLASEMKNLSVFLHVSTAYSNCDRYEVGEQLYPPHADWRKLIKIGESADQNMLNVFSEMIIKKLPNTYVFTKSLAEHVVYDLCEDKIPTVIYRPSIVLGSEEEPIPGWIDNYNGPAGIAMGIRAGVLRTVYGISDIIMDHVPVDTAIKGILIATWLKGLTKNKEEKRKISIYNCTGCYKFSLGTFIATGVELSRELPVRNMLWYPWAYAFKSYYHFSLLFLHLLPALVLDTVLWILHKKPMLVKLTRRIYAGNLIVAHFLSNDWNFLNDNFLALDKKLLPEDAEEFHLKNIGGYKNFLATAFWGATVYLLKEDSSTLEEARKKLRIMLMLHIIFIIALYVSFILVLSQFYKMLV